MPSINIDKIPSCCPTTNHFHTGDILIFNINPNYQKASTHSTLLGQKFLNNSGGHKDAVHTAFVIELDGKKKIVHLRSKGFTIDDIGQMKTVTHVYRPRIHQKEIAAELQKFIQENKDDFKNNLRWKIIVSLLAYMRRVFFAVGIKNNDPDNTPVLHPENLKTSQQMVSSWSVCSKFLAESYAGCSNELSKKDPQHDYRHDLMNISINTIPKTLQAYLYRCSNYDYLVMPHEDWRGKLVDHLIELIGDEVIRLEQGNAPSQTKAVLLDKALKEFIKTSTEEKYMEDDITHDFNQSKILLKKLVPILNINTGNKVKTPTSLYNVMAFANSQGLYAEYFLGEKVFNPNSNDLTKEAKTIYQYSNKLAKMYSDYRKIGYSDEEARFECEPKFSSWMALNPRRNIAAGITVAPLLLYSLPYGIYRTQTAKARNEKLESEEKANNYKRN